MSRVLSRAHRMRTLTAGAALAVAVTGLAVPATAEASPAATVQAATMQAAARAASGDAARVSGNLSPNPVLRHSARGYKIKDGARKLKRVKLRKGKRHAARVVVNQENVRVKLPRNSVVPGQSVVVGASIKAASGERAHVSIGWYDASGNYLSWSGADTDKVRKSTWQRLETRTVAPANARTAEPVVNLLDARRGTKLLITKHTFRTVGGATTAPVTTPERPTTPPASSQTWNLTSSGVDRVRLPIVNVRVGDTMRFSAEVMAATGSKAHVSVNWYDATGNWMNWEGLDIGGTATEEYREFAAQLVVPAGAARAETVVNVFEGPVGTPIAIRNHRTSVVSPVATPAPDMGAMAAPSGSRLVRDLTRASGWDPENGGSLSTLGESGPDGEPVLRSTLVDNQVGASSGQPSERNDLQGGTVPLGSVRWMTWKERFVRIPSTNLDRWNMIGPNEIHGHTLPQATVMPEVGPDGHRRLNANAGRAAARYFDLGAIQLNTWSRYKFGIKYTQGNDGWIEMWKDGVRVLRIEGPTTTENQPGYWKFGHYRNSDINGTSIYDVSGVKVWAP